MMERRDRAMRTAIFSLLLILVTLAQISILPRLFNIHPLWPPLLVVMVAMYEGEHVGMWYGLAAGILMDALMPKSEAFFSITLMLAGLCAGVVSRKYFSKGFAAMTLMCSALLIVMEFTYFLFFFLFTGRAGWSALWLTALPEAGISLLTAPLLYLFVRPISRLGRGRRPDTGWKG